MSVLVSRFSFGLAFMCSVHSNLRAALLHRTSHQLRRFSVTPATHTLGPELFPPESTIGTPYGATRLYALLPSHHIMMRTSDFFRGLVLTKFTIRMTPSNTLGRSAGKVPKWCKKQSDHNIWVSLSCTKCARP